MRALTAALLLAVSGCALAPPGTCSDDTQCGVGQICTNGICVGCDRDADCRAWQGCNGQSRTCVAQPGRCTFQSECRSYELCTWDHFCALAPGACTTAANCTSYEDCTNNSCQLQAHRCSSSNDCPGFFPSCDAGNWCSDEPPDGNDILIWGTLSEGSCGRDAVAPVSKPNVVKVGFDCYSDYGYWSTPAVRNPTGTLVYVDGAREPKRPVRFIADSWHWDTQSKYWSYPSDGNLNDPPMPATACVSTDAVLDFVLQELTGEYAYSCNLAPNDWYDAAGNALVTGGATTTQLRAWNKDGLLLGTYGGVWSIWDPVTRLRHAVTGLPAYPSVIDVRAAGSGFWFAINPTSTSGQIWTINAAGAASKFGDYGPKPAIAGGGYYGVIDKTGALYVEDSDQTIVFNDIVVKYPADGSPGTVIYQESDAPSDANSSPSRLWVFFHISYMFRGP